jgi:branched-subunit amino acid ABC-type transport system permease component
VRTVILDTVGILSSAGGLFIVSVGLTLVFGAMRLINIAHGSFYMLGAFLMTTFAGVKSGITFWLALLIATVLVGLIGATVEVTVMRRLYAKEHLTQLVATFGIFLIFSDIALRAWGNQNRALSAPHVVAGRLSIGQATFPAYDLVVIGVAALTGIGLWLLLTRTPMGWRIRAAVEDPEILAAGGTNLRMLRTGVFVLGAALAGLGGAVVAPQIAVSPGMDAGIIVFAFIVTVVGGLGSVVGAGLGALLIAIAQTLGTSLAPSWASAFTYLAMIVVLALRPWGLLGMAER